MAEHGRVDLDHMRAAYEREREDLARSAVAERARVIRAQASIECNTRMVGRVGRFQLESD